MAHLQADLAAVIIFSALNIAASLFLAFGISRMALTRRGARRTRVITLLSALVLVGLLTWAWAAAGSAMGFLEALAIFVLFFAGLAFWIETSGGNGGPVHAKYDD
jgi:hypothetical protein